MPMLFWLTTVACLCWRGATATADEMSESASPKCLAPPLNVPPSAWSRHARPITIAHRGASAQLPEHSLPAYRLALDLGADYIEPDLVPTKDGYLIAMHTVDLNVTTNVAQVFPESRQTHSSFMNRTGYWSYQFTMEEIKKLKVRQRLPELRPTTFDEMWGIPTLTEILQLVLEWENFVSPLRFNSTLRRAGPGIYAELKESTWVMEDANIDLLELLFNHLERNFQLWENAILKRLCNTKKLKEHEYDLPPLYIQSFEVTVLQQFHDTWKDRLQRMTSSSSNMGYQQVVPPTILLLATHQCREEMLWFQLGEEFRTKINGLGPDKACLDPVWGRDFMERARKLELVVHPYTVRPELQFVMQQEPPLESQLEELLYFFCEVGVDGIFTEDISAALHAAAMDCPSHGAAVSSSGSISRCGDSEPACRTGPQTAVFVVGILVTMFVGIAISVWRCHFDVVSKRNSHTILNSNAEDGIEGNEDQEVV